MRRLVIIETSDIGARYTGLAARKLGYEPLFVCQLSIYQADTLAQIKEFDFIDMPTGRADEIVRALSDVRGIEAVTTFLDSRLEVAVQTAELMNVRGLSSSILKMKDKGYAYQLLPSAMPETLLIHRDQLKQEKIAAFLEAYPRCILKPRKTAGAIGARIFTSRPTYDELIQHMDSVSIPEFLDPKAWMLQQLIDGSLVSMEGFIHRGNFVALGVTGRRKVGQTESVANFPHDHNLNPAIVEKMREACRELLQRADVTSAYFHIEFIHTKDDAYIIDANVGRLGGGGVGELLALVYNLRPIDIFKHVIQVSLDEEAIAPYGERKGEAASVTYGSPQAGLFKDLRYVDRIEGFHTQILDINRVIPAMGGDNWAWIGIATGPMPQIFKQLDELEVVVNNEVLKPCY